MNLRRPILLVITATLFASCANVYTPALYHQDIAYMPKPASFDSVKSATYASAGINGNYNQNYVDMLISGQFNLSRGYVFNNANLAYGVFGVLGDYENSQIQQGQPNYFNDRFFGAVGGRFSANLFSNTGRSDFRFLGIEMAYSHEFGDYLNFRRSVENVPGYYVDPRSDLFTIGLTTEVLFHPIGNTNIQHGIRGFLGYTFGFDDLETNNYYNYYNQTQNNGSKLLSSVFPKASYFIKFKKYFGTVEFGQNIFIRFGLKF